MASVLLYDADLSSQLPLSRRLERSGHNVTLAENPQDCLMFLGKNIFDLLIIDLSQRNDPMSVYETVRSDTKFSNLPILILVADNDASLITAGQSLNPDEIVTKPINPLMLDYRLQRLWSYKTLEKKFVDLQSETSKTLSLDPVTGLMTKRLFLERWKQAIAGAKRYKFPISIMILDIDLFSTVNQRWSREVGDAYLKAVSATLEANLRGDDVLARTGSDEFALFLSHTGIIGAQVVAGKLRTAVESLHALPDNGKRTISLGMASSDTTNLDEIYKGAERALFQARSMRNTLALWKGGTADGQAEVI